MGPPDFCSIVSRQALRLVSRCGDAWAMVVLCNLLGVDVPAERHVHAFLWVLAEPLPSIPACASQGAGRVGQTRVLCGDTYSTVWEFAARAERGGRWVVVSCRAVGGWSGQVVQLRVNIYEGPVPADGHSPTTLNPGIPGEAWGALQHRGCHQIVARPDRLGQVGLVGAGIIVKVGEAHL